jgi:hypothetical protein
MAVLNLNYSVELVIDIEKQYLNDKNHLEKNGSIKRKDIN